MNSDDQNFLRELASRKDQTQAIKLTDGSQVRMTRDERARLGKLAEETARTPSQLLSDVLK
jgi:hypothetical protein